MVPGELPNILGPLVAEFGETQVRGAGQVLGYPATWITDPTEVRAVLRHLTRRA